MNSISGIENSTMSEEQDETEQSNMAAQRRKHQQQKQKKSTKEKIDRLMSDGAKNYPAYLKLIYTGESELSSEDEFSVDLTTNRKTNPSNFDGEFTPTDATTPVNEKSFDGSTVTGRKSSVHGSMTESLASSMSSSIGSYSSSYNSSASLTRGQDRKGKMIGTPESDKLLDPGREKQGSPVDSCGSGERRTIERSASGASLDMTSSYSGGTKQSPFCAHWSSEFPSPFTPPSPRDDVDKEGLRDELNKVQDDIATLKMVLTMKQKEAADLRQKLGQRPISDFKQSLQNLKESEAFQKTNAVCKSFSAYASRKMDNFRNLNMFKAIEYNKDPSYGGMKHSQSTDELTVKQSSLPTSKSDTNVARRLMTNQQKKDNSRVTVTKYYRT